MNSTKKSLYRFIFFYVSSTMIILVAFSVLFFQYEKKLFIDNQRISLKQSANRVVFLMQEHRLEKIRDIKNIKYSFYSGRREYLGGNAKLRVLNWNLGIKKIGDSIQMVYPLSPPHPRHMAFLIVEKKIDYKVLKNLSQNIVLSLFVALIVLLVTGYFLGLLFVKPMKRTIKQLDEFIQDATHELNTPISTILNNIEMMQILHKCQDSQELKRVKIASKTLSKIFEDLSYIRLYSTIQKEIKIVDISKILIERLEYFNLLFESKNIILNRFIEPNIIKKVDKSDITRVFDNLISNAIKYNKNGGQIDIFLDSKSFKIRDSGVGIPKDKLYDIFNRFQRANASEGGFGLGLSIVKQILDYYQFKIDLSSKEGVGSEVIIYF